MPSYYCQTSYSTLQNEYLPHLGKSTGNRHRIFTSFGSWKKTLWLFFFLLWLHVAEKSPARSLESCIWSLWLPLQAQAQLPAPLRTPGSRIVPYGALHLHWKSELGALNNVTSKLSTSQFKNWDMEHGIRKKNWQLMKWNENPNVYACRC